MHRSWKMRPFSFSFMALQVIYSRTMYTKYRIRIFSIAVVTQQVCDEKDPNSNQPKNPLKEFCAEQINSDVLLDLIARFGDYNRKNSNNEPACLYYGITSRHLKLQNNQGIALGWLGLMLCKEPMRLQWSHIPRMVMERTTLWRVERIIELVSKEEWIQSSICKQCRRRRR